MTHRSASDQLIPRSPRALPVRYYRTSNGSVDLRRCHDFGDSSGCVGGVSDGEGPCKPGLEGPYCSLCTIRDRSHYYSSDDSACLACEGDELWPLWVALGVLAGLLGLLALGWRCRRRAPRRLRMCFAWLWGICAQLSLHAKSKQILGFCEPIATLLPSPPPPPQSLSY